MKIKKRETVKTILIIFLLILLVLTLFSNTIMNRSLPEISTSQVLSGTITKRVRGSGSAHSEQVYNVTVSENRTIDKIMIHTGQNVKENDILFILSDEKSDEIAQAESALDALEVEYKKLLLNVPADYSGENKAIELAREELNAAISKRDAAIEKSVNKESETAEYNTNKTQSGYYADIITKLKITIAAIDTDEYTSAEPEYTGELVRLRSDYNSAENDYSSALSMYSSVLSSGESDPEAVTQLKDEAGKKQSLMNQAKKKYEDKKYSVRASLTSQLYEAEQNSRKYAALVSEYEAKYSGDISDDYSALEAEVTEKEKSLQNMIYALNKSEAENNILSKSNKLDIDAKKREIKRQTKKLEELKERYSDTEIKSKYSGIVGEINIKTGDITAPDTPLAVINIISESYSVEFPVSRKQGEMVNPGVKADVVNDLNRGIEAVLTEIRNDTENQTDDKILTFKITGDINTGDNIELSIPCGSADYDAIVPKNAVYQDSSGYFVLTVDSESSPLGNRYFAKKINVETLASDDTSTAVSGNIKNNDYVITASGKPIKSGDQVRIKLNENND